MSLRRFYIKDKLILSQWICLFLFVFSLFYFPSVSSNLPTDPSRLIRLLFLVCRRETEAQRAETACPLQPLARMRMSHLTCSHVLIRCSSKSSFIPPWTDLSCKSSLLCFLVYSLHRLLLTEAHRAFVNCELNVPTSHMSLSFPLTCCTRSRLWHRVLMNILSLLHMLPLEWSTFSLSTTSPYLPSLFSLLFFSFLATGFHIAQANFELILCCWGCSRTPNPSVPASNFWDYRHMLLCLAAIGLLYAFPNRM